MILQREWEKRKTLLHDGRIAVVPPVDGDVEQQDPPTFKAPEKLKGRGAEEADLSEVGGILE